MNSANAIITAPYPGLRPFKQEEAELFFGRESQTNEMLTRLEDKPDFRFLAVIGSSGSGKSSLVRAGLLPALGQGFLLGAPADWKFVTARPGAAPLQSLANAWVDTFHPRTDQPDAAESERYHFVLAQLRAGPLGLVRAYRGEQEIQGHAVLILIDQFEELFRFRRERVSARRAQPVLSTTQSGQAEPLDETSRSKTSPTTDNALTLEQQRNEAAAFVELLLATAQQTEVPMYVVITMRSDFLGDCDAFLGLPEAISRSQYLTPRMTRSQLADAITRPLERPQFNASIVPTLVNRILNDVGTDPDQLPLVQHALLRTWRAAVDRLQADSASRVQLSSSDYDISGGVKHALSQDADKALEELRKMERGEYLVRMAEMLFRSLAHQSEAARLVRRPVQVSEVLGVVSDEPTPQDCEDLNQVLTTFEGSGRHFLMRTTADWQSAVEQPLVPVELNTPTSNPTDFIDISHESLLRQWKQVQLWFRREADAARQYRRLVDAVQAGERRLTGDALDRALDWCRTRRTPTWAMRYDNALTPEESLLPQCLELIEKSKKLRDSEEAEAEFARKSHIVKIVIAVVVLTSFNFFLINDPLREQLQIERDNFDLPINRDNVIEVFLNQGIVVLPRKHFKSLKTTEWTSKDSKEDFKSKVSNILEDSSIWKYIDTDWPPRNHVKVALSNRVKLSTIANLKESSFYKEFTSSKNVIFLKVNDFLEKNSAERSIYVLPQRVRVALRKEHQPRLIQAALNLKKPFGLEPILERPERVQGIGRIFLLVIHLLAYFALVFGVQIVYRGFAFHDNEFLEHFQVQLGRSKVVFSLVLLLFGLVLFSVGLVRFVQGVGAEPPMLILGVPVGVILILLVPTDTLLKRSWVPRFKKAQGILLQLYGFYALAGSVSLLLMEYEYDWKPVLLLVRNPWALVIAGIGLVIMGKRKCALATDETLICEPERPPGLVNSQTRLYSDCAIGLAAFFLFGWGLPAGVMMFRNLWRIGRRRMAGIGLVTPFVGIVGITGFLYLIIDKYYNDALEIEAVALLVMVWLGSPFATYWLWRHLSGREIRHHGASGGAFQPRWKALLVLLIAGALGWLSFVGVKDFMLRAYFGTYVAAREKVDKGQVLARQGNEEEAIAAFEKAQKLAPNIDLSRETGTNEKDPRAIAQQLAAHAKVEEGIDRVWAGDIAGAITAFRAAQQFDSGIDLDPSTKAIETDPQAVAQQLAARAKAEERIDEGRKLARQGDVEKAYQAYAEAEKLDPSLATDAQFWNDVAWDASLGGGNAAQALEASEKAVSLAAQALEASEKDDLLAAYLLAAFRDTRGLARALTGDTQGAIEDFEAFIGSDWPREIKAQRQQWVDALRRGEQPFTPQLLEKLRSE